MQEQLDGCLAGLHSLGGSPGTVKEDKAAWRRYWVPLTELLGVVKSENPPPPPDAILREGRLLCK
eukprot:6206377-Pleurochrysis_carterae.AAC.1